MSEYFVWANLSKREKLCSDAFEDYGFMLNCSTCTTTSTTRAAETLLAGPWKNDIVIYLGDYFTYDECWRIHNPNIARLFEQSVSQPNEKYNTEYPWEVVLNEFKDIGGRFIESKGREYTEYWGGDNWEDKIYDGPFDLSASDFKFAICEPLKEYVSLGMTWSEFNEVKDGDFETLTFDPLPKLLCARDKPYQLTGRWSGFPVRTANDKPSEEYELLLPNRIDDSIPLEYA